MVLSPTTSIGRIGRVIGAPKCVNAPFHSLLRHGLIRPRTFLIFVWLLCIATAPAWAAGAGSTGENAQGTAYPYSIKEIKEKLEARVAKVHDVTATVTFVQIAARDGSHTEGKLELAAIFPDLIRATWIKPDYFTGVVWILDTERNTLTQYIPATGEASLHPLDEILSERSAMPLTPEQLFTLPPSDQFDLSIVDAFSLPQDGGSGSNEFVVVRAQSKDALVYKVWVDVGNWLVTKVQSLTAEGTVQFSAEAGDITINQGLDAAYLRRLPPGTIEHSSP